MARKLTPDQKLQRLGSKVLKARLSKGWSRQQLGDEAGCSRAYIFQVENGRQCPNAFLMNRIAEALDLPFSFFVS